MLSHRPRTKEFGGCLKTVATQVLLALRRAKTLFISCKRRLSETGGASTPSNQLQQQVFLPRWPRFAVWPAHISVKDRSDRRSLTPPCGTGRPMVIGFLHLSPHSFVSTSQSLPQLHFSAADKPRSGNAEHAIHFFWIRRNGLTSSALPPYTTPALRQRCLHPSLAVHSQPPLLSGPLDHEHGNRCRRRQLRHMPQRGC